VGYFLLHYHWKKRQDKNPYVIPLPTGSQLEMTDTTTTPGTGRDWGTRITQYAPFSESDAEAPTLTMAAAEGYADSTVASAGGGSGTSIGSRIGNTLSAMTASSSGYTRIEDAK
jgi:hypothetical protein